jgi:hypothetical protein
MLYDFEKFDSRKEYGEYIESKEIGTLIKWCKENKSSKDKGASLAAEALIKYLTEGEFPYSKCKAKKKRGRFKGITELDYYIWGYARVKGVSQASREFKENAKKVDKNINSKFEPKTIRDHIHKLADYYNTDYQTMMGSNSFPHADLNNEEKYDKPHGLHWASLFSYYKYLSKAKGLRRREEQKIVDAEEAEDAEKEKKYEEYKNIIKAKNAEAIAAGVEYKKSSIDREYLYTRFWEWAIRAREFDNKQGK